MKKSYAKIKAQELESAPPKSNYLAGIFENDAGDNGQSNSTQQDNGLHPEREALLYSEIQRLQREKEREEEQQEEATSSRSASQGQKHERRKRPPKPSPFAKELDIAKKRKEEVEARRRLREAKERERQAMARARRPDQFGKRRLGRESTVLLDKVKRVVGES